MLSAAENVNTSHLLRVEKDDAQHGIEGKHHRSQHEDAARAFHSPVCCMHGGSNQGRSLVTCYSSRDSEGYTSGETE